MQATAAAETAGAGTATGKSTEPLWRRKYVVPFALACVILACTQPTGAASIISYNTTILIQAGLDDLQAHHGYVLLTAVNFVMTIGGVLLVDRKGRKFLLCVGTVGIVASLTWVALLFHGTEQRRVDCREAVQALVTPERQLTLVFNPKTAARPLAGHPAAQALAKAPATLSVIYSYGGFRGATQVVRSDDTAAKPLEITPASSLPPNRVVAFFSNAG